jgi:tetratricopeptide (TPR) repeat protein
VTDPGEKKRRARAAVLAAVLLAAGIIGVIGFRRASARICDQTEIRVLQALDRDRHAEALALLDGADRSCRKRATLRGMRAEALVRANRTGEALQAAREVLKSEPEEKHAVYTLAHAAWVAGEVDRAHEQARVAVGLGRRAPAHLLLGLIANSRNDLPQAKSEFDAMLRQDANDLTALFNLAFVDQRMNRYRNAREGYLKVLRLDPKHLDARHNLVLLTLGAGARAEAEHHLRKLAEVAPGDERVARLRAALAAAPAAGSPPAAAVTAPIREADR